MRLFSSLIAFALPPRCAGCGSVVGADLELCATCWTSLEFLTAPGCTTCGAPIAIAGLVCARCLAKPPRHDGVRAAVVYGAVARTIALRLKHGRRVALARLMARLMLRHVSDRSALLVPVPLHRWRLWYRGFNQAALIARAIARETGQPLALDLLVRTRATPMLRGLGAVERARTLAGAFAVAPSARAQLKGRHILLIDDVHTSGATANGCARALKRAGAARVEMLCWARVIAPQAN